MRQSIPMKLFDLSQPRLQPIWVVHQKNYREFLLVCAKVRQYRDQMVTINPAHEKFPSKIHIR
jgi:hypothetical protein